MARKTYNEKLNDSKQFPTIEEVTDPRAIERFAGTKMLIAPPLAYDAIMKKIPVGRITTSDAIRAHLAKAHGADYTCPLTAGIFMNIAAHASRERGTQDTPYWRALKKGGELNEKYPDGIDGHKLLLEMEGHTIVQKGKRCYVLNYQDKLFPLEQI